MKNVLILVIILLKVSLIFCQDKEIPNYNSLVDSSEIYTDEDPTISLEFLKSIDKPLVQLKKNKPWKTSEFSRLLKGTYEENK